MKRRDLMGILGATMLMPAKALARNLAPVGDGYVLVDPRIELMSVIHLLAGYPLTTRSAVSYKREALSFFAPFRGHHVVAMARDLADTTLSFDAVPDLLLRLSEPPALTWRKDLILQPTPGMPDERQRAEFLTALRDFALVSGFQAFFDRHEPLYRHCAEQVSPMVTPNVLALERYVGASLDHWQVIAGPLMHDGGFGPHFKRRDGTYDTYALIGPVVTSVGEPDFGDTARLQNLVVHEFAHSLINPLAARQADAVAAYAARFDDLRSVMRRQAYGDWPTVVNEHVVRAVTARIAARHDAEAGESAVADEVRRGFVYVPALVERLKVYERQRQRWATLAVFYPVLLKGFEQPAPAPVATPGSRP